MEPDGSLIKREDVHRKMAQVVPARINRGAIARPCIVEAEARTLNLAYRETRLPCEARRPPEVPIGRRRSEIELPNGIERFIEACLPGRATGRFCGYGLIHKAVRDRGR